MKFKKQLVAIALISMLSISLVACGSNGRATDAKNNTKIENNKGETKKTEIESIDNLNIEQTQGPIRAKVIGVEKSKLHLSEKDFEELGVNYPDLTKNGQDLNLVGINIEIENTSDNTIDVYPRQGSLALNTKEQIEDIKIFPGSEELSGEYLGNTLKKNMVVFVVDSNLNDISNLKYKFNAYEEFGSGDEDVRTYDFLLDIDIK